MSTLTYQEQLHHVVQIAGLSPSVHNTQPWRFALLDDGFELRADRSKGLRVLDGDGRQLHLSCGSALYHARVAARALGLNARVQMLPDHQDPTLLARVTITQGHPPRFDEVQLATAILHRHTFRGAFDPDPVPEALVERLREVAEAEGAVLRRVSREDEVIELAVLVDHATRDEERDPAYREELQSWLRTDPAGSDGLPAQVVDLTDQGSPVRQRDFTLTHQAGVDGSAPPADHPLLVVLGTALDEPEAWLRAGQALAAVLLNAAESGVQAQPIGQVTDTTGYRRRLQHTLSMLTMPQLVLRMGRAPQAKAGTPRRSLDDVLLPAPR
jgi:nitroreductase